MNPRQERFVEEYIRSGNASEAARLAGYNPNTAGQIGAENLKKPYIRQAIDARLRELKTANTAETQEVLERLTSIMRGIATEERISANGKKFKVEASISDRIAAADKLLRVAGAYRDKVQVELSATEKYIAALEAADELIREDG